ncbi:S8 family serine peptidase [Paenarthrobacter sp. Z7-10]|uniref:S8 family serine peptidase n=1 Tax=Paenarthrobacter sp. Z7-10 TaxID=2787635 RepID=UPI0022A9D631|nr:S8 family serine peptidase [Paenarthrobacter sp. Z7-10]MCZ2402845.1 S8 family serine peptidase [Paenarthrobacter sp. Z7-10]
MSKQSRRARSQILATLTGLAIVATMGNAAMADDSKPPSNLAVGISGQKAPAQLKPAQKMHGNLNSASGPVSVYVQFKGQGTFAATQSQKAQDGTAKPVDKSGLVKQLRAGIEATAKAVTGAASAKQIYITTNTLPGVAIIGDAAKVRALANRDDVVKITPIVAKSYQNKGTDIDTKALNAWVQNHQTGAGATIAVLDTGLDYTHADFGGPGTTAAFAAAKAMTDLPPASANLYDPAKFAGGYDLVGDDYNAGSTDPAARMPHPDGNPLDCAGHGSHVAGTAAGFGLKADGSTFTGDYTKLTAAEVNAMKIGPGSAPMAKLVSLRVFGCEGSSDVVGLALDKVLDPNGDGDFSDRANVVNMSLGSDYSPTDDPENDIVNALTDLGVLSVVASGNAGDVYDIGGSPGNAKSALTVANSVGSQAAVDRIDVLAPADKVGSVAGQYSANFNYSDPAVTPAMLKGTVQFASGTNNTGCNPFTTAEAAVFAGKWVMLSWDDNDATRECGSAKRYGNAEAAGAKGVVFDSQRTVFEAGIAGNATIPGVQFNKAATDSLTPAAKAGTLQIQLNPNYKGAASAPTGALDTLNSSSSRGVHGSNGIVKPDVAAPGTSIGSVGVGSGNGIAVMSGTSMATPHVAGIAALLYAKGGMTPYQVKSTIMNTANVDIMAGNVAYGPNRVGSGRVNALDAVSDSVLAFASNDPSLTSVNFGVVEVADQPVTVTKKITVQNRSNSVQTFDASYLPATEMPGVAYSVSPVSIMVPANSSAAQVSITMTVADPTKLAKSLDPTMSATQLGGVPRTYLADASGRVQLKSANSPTLRVPVYAAPKPVSTMTAGSKITFKPSETTANVTLTGRGVLQGTGTQQFISIAAPFELGASSERKADNPVATVTNKSMDLQYVGASTTVPAVVKAGGDVAKDGMINFGISTWGDWPALLASSGISVEIDTTGDGKADFETYTAVVDGLDGIVVFTDELKADGTRETVDQQFANGLPADAKGNTIDTNTYDTNTVMLPVLASSLGLDLTKSAPISYKVVTYSSYSIDKSGQNVPVDQTPAIAFNPVTPNLWFEGSAPDSLFVDANATQLTVHRASKGTKAKALFLHLHNATGQKAEVVATENGKLRFSDVPGTKFEADINWMADNGLTTGYPDGTYRPYGTMNRDAMAAFLYRLAGSPAYSAPAKSPFTDINPNTQYYKEMSWMSSMKLSMGYDDGSYRPLSAVNRDAMAAFLKRFAGDYCMIPAAKDYEAPATSEFKDVATNNEFYKEISWMGDTKISTGYPDGSYHPLEANTREAMAAFIHRLDTYEGANGGCHPTTP